MDVEAAIGRLPETHATALRLRARGFDDDAIAAALALVPEAVGPLLRIADAKLATLTADGSGPTEAGRDLTGNRLEAGRTRGTSTRPTSCVRP